MSPHDTSPPRPAFFNEGKGADSTKSNPSSLKSFSMKGKISFISGLLSKTSSRANIRESVLTTAPGIAPDVSDNEKTELSNEIPTRTAQRENTKPVDRKKAAQLNHGRANRSFPSTKRLSTTFRKSSQSPQPASRVPIPSAHSRQLREAALRERGLLPPKDMSAQEREQDNQMSPVFPLSQAVYTDGLSEADRIKQSWEAKIQPYDTIGHEELLDSAVGQATKPEDANGSFDEAVREVTVPPSSPKPTPPIRKSSSRARLAKAKLPPTSELPPTPLGPESIPLPPSPVQDTFISVEIPFQPSFSASSPPSTHITHFPQSLPEEVTLHCTSAPSGLSPAPPPQFSAVLLHSSTVECFEDGTLAPTILQSSNRPSVVINSCSDSDESGSIATPSLDTSSQLTSESPLSHTTHMSKPFPLLKTWTNEPSVPVIVESPIEGPGLVIPINDIPEEEEVANYVSSSPRARPESDGKRKHLLGARSTSSNRAGLGKFGGKIGRSNSLAVLRQSVVGTLSRKPSSFTKKSAAKSNLPPSPTVSSSLATQSINSSMSAQSIESKDSFSYPSSRQPRQALSPTIHGRGSFLFETSHIEDEETRRMTEMAFMG
ncbi:hypothetical protein J3R30DRAFT_3484801 [Lentinula aciculospora]|uniref:Uncharacterized protein n=1 Tax=Lentinula aciculospora TaxID=153920 RepID=A0A9W9DNF9_9AGAR|nr:hypothetical protein J3R30DRAFT_3484801 [Lentinula aciculospora]